MSLQLTYGTPFCTSSSVKHGLHDCASVAFFRSRAQESPGIHVSHLDTWTKPPQQSTLLLDTGGGSRGACGM